nr:uncharacterized protein LOC112581576 [Bubalus bubalis]
MAVLEAGCSRAPSPVCDPGPPGLNIRPTEGSCSDLGTAVHTETRSSCAEIKKDGCQVQALTGSSPPPPSHFSLRNYTQDCCDRTSFLLDRHKDDLSIPVRGQVGAQSGPEGPTPWDPGGGSSEGRGQQGGSPGVGAGTLGCFQVPAPATDADGDADAHTACPSSVSMRASHSASALRTSVYGAECIPNVYEMSRCKCSGVPLIHTSYVKGMAFFYPHGDNWGQIDCFLKKCCITIPLFLLHRIKIIHTRFYPILSWFQFYSPHSLSLTKFLSPPRSRDLPSGPPGSQPLESLRSAPSPAAARGGLPSSRPPVWCLGLRALPGREPAPRRTPGQAGRQGGAAVGVRPGPCAPPVGSHPAAAVSWSLPGERWRLLRRLRFGRRVRGRAPEGQRQRSRETREEPAVAGDSGCRSAAWAGGGGRCRCPAGWTSAPQGPFCPRAPPGQLSGSRKGHGAGVRGVTPSRRFPLARSLSTEYPIEDDKRRMLK